MAKITKNNSLKNTGYSKGFQMLTNFIFEIISIEYRDNLYGYFTIKVTRDNKVFVLVKDISICSYINPSQFETRLLEEGNYICNPNITNEDILDIFSYEFDQYKIAIQIKELQKEQLAYGNQAVALEGSSFSKEDKETLRAHYSTKQNELQERINKLTNELSVVDSETIIVQTHYSD